MKSWGGLLKRDGWVPITSFPDGKGCHGTGLNVHGPKNKKYITIWARGDEKLAELELTKGHSTIIDYEDLEDVIALNWCSSKVSGIFKRVMSTIGGKSYLLHQLISDMHFQGDVLDHINTEYPESYEFDNRKCNLRKCNKRQNAKNLPRGRADNNSGYQCIYRNTHDTCWSVNVRFKGKKLYVPSFPDSRFSNPLQEAILCRDVLKEWLIEEDFTKTPCLDNIQDKQTRDKVLLYINRVQEKECKL